MIHVAISECGADVNVRMNFVEYSTSILVTGNSNRNEKKNVNIEGKKIIFEKGMNCNASHRNSFHEALTHFMKFAGIKRHSSCTHAFSKVKFTCISDVAPLYRGFLWIFLNRYM